ncbi:uncharacterized protein LOC134228605, partial [Saccostrea cucullata]|uniref:uncharacterized protein LOC134228605 n=1 Tax=Saccostrea cuccullata TaxID=36930 RepID=UPI002ED119C3
NVTSSFCCTNYDRDRNGDCNVCAPGYFGKLCDAVCPRGKFGEGCAGVCACSLEDCDHVTGCPLISQLRTTEAVTGLHLTKIHISTQSVSSGIIITELPIPSTESYKISTSATLKPYITIKSRTILYSSGIQTTEIPSDRTTTGQFNSNYTILGVGLILAILLIVVIVQLRLRSKSSHKTISKEEGGENNEINALSDSSKMDIDIKQYSRLKEDKVKGHVYQRVQSEYQEIEECLEMVDNPAVLKSGSQSKLEMAVESSCLENYIDPVITTENISRQRHSYIEILDTDAYTGDENLNDECNEISSKSSSSYDDVIVECSTVTSDIVQRDDNTYLDVLFE